MAIPLQAPYIMSKHAVLALTECLHLDVQSAGHDHHIHVQAVLPGAVVSNIFESAGGVDSNAGDVAAAEAQRSAMLDIKAAAMDPLAAAETVFEQAAEGRFYLLTQQSVASAMADRANVLAAQRPPALRWTPAPRSRRRRAGGVVRSDPADARNAAWLRCAPRSNPRRCPMKCPRWPDIGDARYPAPPDRFPSGSTVPQTVPVSPRWSTFMAADSSWAPIILSNRWPASLRRRRAPPSWPSTIGWPRNRRRPRSSTTPTPRPSGYRENADDLGVDAGRVAVVGDSAGGSLAAAVALAARDRGGPAICAQVLLYPGLDRDMTAPSITALPDAPLLVRDDIDYMHALADGDAGPPRDPYLVPAYASDLSGLPPAIVVTAGCDPIQDWGERYAARLREAGVQTTTTRYPGMYHGFLMRSDATARGRLAIAEIGALLRAKFAHPVQFDVPITGHDGAAAR